MCAVDKLSNLLIIILKEGLINYKLQINFTIPFHLKHKWSVCSNQTNLLNWINKKLSSCKCIFYHQQNHWIFSINFNLFFFFCQFLFPIWLVFVVFSFFCWYFQRAEKKRSRRETQFGHDMVKKDRKKKKHGHNLDFYGSFWLTFRICVTQPFGAAKVSMYTHSEIFVYLFPSIVTLSFIF